MVRNISNSLVIQLQCEIKALEGQVGDNFIMYYETFENIGGAINREKAIKGVTRMKKEKLINSINPFWEDLPLYLV
jgi:predicted GIY-YIG superfamily endonuclease